jgi:hypothetical protein
VHGAENGYRRGADDRPEQDPDLRVREALSLVFGKFGEIGSVRQLALWLRQERIDLPTVVHGAPHADGAIYRLAALLHGFGARREPSKGSLRGQ